MQSVCTHYRIFVQGRGEQARRHDVALADDSHVDGKVMSTELNPPGRRERGRAE